MRGTSWKSFIVVCRWCFPNFDPTNRKTQPTAECHVLQLKHSGAQKVILPLLFDLRHRFEAAWASFSRTEGWISFCRDHRDRQNLVHKPTLKQHNLWLMLVRMTNESKASRNFVHSLSSTANLQLALGIKMTEPQELYTFVSIVILWSQGTAPLFCGCEV